MTSLVSGALRGALWLCAAAAAAGCSVSARPVQLGAEPEVRAGEDGPAPPRLTMTPAVIPGDGEALVQISAPGADSLAFESVNGLDRYGTRDSNLVVVVGSRFGETATTMRYAVREHGYLFDTVKRPIKITTCRQRRCRAYYHDLTIKLLEYNERSVALTAGWSTAFTKRAITGQDKVVLLRDAVNNSLWSVQAELATHGLNARLQGYYNTGEQGGSGDLSQTFKPNAGEMGYGIAMHLAARRVGWLPDDIGSGSQSRSAYQASIGPSIMLKGLTVSSQYGVYTDGQETLQLLSTFVSFNGNLTDVRSPFSVTIEKTFAFGGDAIVPRRRDGTERMTLGFQVAPGVALRVGTNSRRSSWPINGTSDNIQASEVYYSLGVQYTLTW